MLGDPNKSLTMLFQVDAARVAAMRERGPALGIGMEVLHQGEDPDTIRAAGDAFVAHIRGRQQLSGELSEPAEERARGAVERTLSSGGALLRLTVLPDSTLSYRLPLMLGGNWQDADQ